MLLNYVKLRLLKKTKNAEFYVVKKVQIGKKLCVLLVSMLIVIHPTSLRSRLDLRHSRAGIYPRWDGTEVSFSAACCLVDVW